MKHCDNFSPLRMDLEASTSVIQKVKVSDLTKKVLALCRNFRESQIERICWIDGPIRKITKLEGKKTILFLVFEHAKMPRRMLLCTHLLNIFAKCLYT